MYSQPLRIRSPPNRPSDRKPSSSWFGSRPIASAGSTGGAAAEGGGGRGAGGAGGASPRDSAAAGGNPKSPLSRGGRLSAGSRLPRSKISLSDDECSSFESPPARSPSSPRSPSCGDSRVAAATGAAKLLPHIPPPSHAWTNHRFGFSSIGHTGSGISSSSAKGVIARSRKGGGYGGDSTGNGGVSPGPSSPWRRAGGSASGSGGGGSVAARLQNILLVIILFLCSNFAGHYYPFLWSPAARASLLATRQRLPDIRTGRGGDEWNADGGNADGGNADGGMSLSDEGRRSIMALAAADGLRESGFETRWGDGGVEGREGSGEGVGETDGVGGGVPRRAWQSRFVRDVRVDVGAEPLCSDIVPDEFRQSTDQMQPVTSLLDFLRPNERFLAFLPRHGLGNSLRGFVSAFVYASLAGRRLVRLHAGQHAKVYDLLCQAYACSFDAGSVGVVRSASEGRSGTGTELLRKFAMLRPVYFLERYSSFQTIAASLQSDYPVLATRSGTLFDLFWHRSDRLRSCVFAAFHCSSVWCVHSRAMFSFLTRNGPTPALASTISAVLHRVPHTGSDSSDSKNSSTQAPDNTGSSSSSSSSSSSTADPAAAAASSLESEAVHAGPEIEFDVGFHVRTRTLAVEKVIKQSADTYQEADCEDPDDSPDTSSSSSSSSTTSTSSTSTSSTSSSGGGGGGGGGGGRGNSTYPRPKFLRNCFWECIGGILSTLRSMRVPLTSKEPANSRHPSSSSSSSSSSREGSREGTREFSIFLATDDEENRPEFVSRLAQYGTVYFSSGAIFHTSKAGGSGGTEGLESSSWVTGADSSSNRSSSRRSSSSSSLSVSSTSGDIPGSVARRLPTMAEFFLLSKARTIIEAGSYISTFAYFAGLLGNGTLSSVDMKGGQCRLHHEHVAQGMFG
ncbi:hypothetical protein CLOM_g1581 [Closterium sp. NIES-68]|nr:hypothetical protein CLOM_g1581 [Closterium sp. NIES-68]